MKRTDETPTTNPWRDGFVRALDEDRARRAGDEKRIITTAPETAQKGTSLTLLVHPDSPRHPIRQLQAAARVSARACSTSAAMAADLIGRVPHLAGDPAEVARAVAAAIGDLPLERQAAIAIADKRPAAELHALADRLVEADRHAIGQEGVRLRAAIRDLREQA